MSFIHYLILGMVAYGSGFAIRRYHLEKGKGVANKSLTPASQKSTNSPLVYQLTAGFFVIMLVVAWALNTWVLENATPDFAFIIMCSLVGTFIFYQGLALDKNHQVPD